MDFSKSYFVHYYEADPARRLTLPALVQYFEDIAILHSAARGYDLEYFDENRRGWMLLKWDIAIKSLPRFGEEVTIVTRVHAMKRFLADREFTMKSRDGFALVEARSNWLFADMDKRRPIKIDEAQYGAFGVSPESERDFVSISDVDGSGTLGDARQAAASARSISVKTANTDIDTNRHVNNVSYINWALDALPEGFAESHAPSRLHVQYRKELALGCDAEVVTSVETVGASAYSRHAIRSGDDECCSIGIRWE